MKTSEEKQSVGIKGWHRLSMSDIRVPAAKRLQDEIVAYESRQATQIRGVLSSIFALRACLLAGRASTAIEDEITRLRAVLVAKREEKHLTLAQMFEALRGASLTFDVSVPNIIPTAGRSVIARWIIGDNTYSGDDGANYGSLGTSAAAVANGDTQLTAETYRKATSSVARASNVATLANFYTASEVTGTFEEAGWHIAGTAGANTGQLLSHFLTGQIVKSATETLTCQSQLTIS